jgi:hypothetical protein
MQRRPRNFLGMFQLSLLYQNSLRKLVVYIICQAFALTALTLTSLQRKILVVFFAMVSRILVSNLDSFDDQTRIIN